MGVTLERVQNKFACIIGELSNNPLILSQFAIWVDLRISEYKSKGAISLECSGDEPDPSWLLGHKTSPRRVPQREQTPDDYCYDDIEDSSTCTDNWGTAAGSIPVETLNQRLNPESEVVQVKEELIEFKEKRPVFPGRMQANEKRFGTWGRKRKSVHNSDKDLISEYNPDHASFSPKIRPQAESFSSIETTEFPKSESFQSIVKETMQEQGSSSPVMDDDGDDDEESFSVHEENLEDSSLVDTPSTSNMSDSTTHRASRFDIDPHLYPKNFPECFTNNSIRLRIPDLRSIPPTSCHDIVKAVALLQRWIWAKYDDIRFIEEMSAEELDGYLTEFWPIVKKDSGEGYTLKSYLKIRSNLERFLRGNNYPFSICKSAPFRASQSAFKNNMRNQLPSTLRPTDWGFYKKLYT